MEIDINKVEYSNSAEGPIIHIFGRDRKGVSERIDVVGFRSYFYAAVEDVEGKNNGNLEIDKEDYRTIRGESVKKIFVKNPSDVREVREKYQHFEADVLFTTRFLIDRGLTGGVSSPKNRVDYTQLKPIEIKSKTRLCMIDLECSDDKGWPDPEHSEIICITAWDSFEKKYMTFLLSPREGTEEEICRKYGKGGFENGCFVEENHGVLIYRDEKIMLQEFSRYIQDRDPDVISGWNVAAFDVPYLLGRFAALELDSSDLARLPGQTNRPEIRGRAIFDLLSGYQKMNLTRKESYRLDAIAEDELKENKVHFKGKIGDLWRENPANLVNYNYQDVRICVMLEEKKEIVGFFREMSRYVGMPLDRTTSSSAIVDTFVLRKAHGRFVLPSKGDNTGEKFEGAVVFDPVKGLHENVIVLDLKSLYPMIMMTLNSSPDTKDAKGTLWAPNGVRFKSTPDGLVREILKELLEKRDVLKTERNKYEYGSYEYKKIDTEQAVIKIITNTYYGVSGNPQFRLMDREIGAAVTSTGRAILEWSRKIIESEGYTVIAGDTDSNAVLIPEEDREKTILIAKHLEKLLNASYGEFAKKTLNADVHYFSTKFEKLYRRFFSGGTKKRYAGLLVWKEGQTVEDVDIVGYENRRSDSPQITRDTQKEVMGLILHGKGFEAVRDYLNGVLRKYRRGEYPLEEIGIPGGIGKGLAEYENPDAQIRGAIYANEHLDLGFGKGSKPKRLYIKAVTGKYPQTDVICFEYGDQIPPEFVVDTEKMLEKTLMKPISRITEALGWSWESLDSTITTWNDWGSK